MKIGFSFVFANRIINSILYNMIAGKSIYYIIFMVSLLLISAYASKRWKAMFEPKDEYEMIKNYLLTDSPLYGFNKPKIWIHSKFEYNARKWESFHSRSSLNLNQPYIHLTIRTIIEHCGDDFHVCLIDDETFNKLIPSWDLDLLDVAEPMRSQIREIGMAELVYYYGGMVLPNSFVCLDSLLEMYKGGTEGDKMFVCQAVNQTSNTFTDNNRPMFIPSTYIFGANRDNETLKKYIQYLKLRHQSPHFSSAITFSGESSQWLLREAQLGNVRIVGGEVVGVKTAKQRPVLLENLMEEEYLDLSPSCLGIYIPEDELLRRTKYQWFAVLSSEELLNTPMIITKYLKKSLVSLGEKPAFHPNPHKTVSAI